MEKRMDLPDWMYSQLKSALSALGYRRYREYLQSPHWFEVSGKLLRDKCERCDETRRLALHHKHYNTLTFESIDDMLTLCQKCHKEEHVRLMKAYPQKKKDKPRKRYPSKQSKRRKEAIEALRMDPKSGWNKDPKTPYDRMRNNDLISDMMIRMDQQRRCRRYSFDYHNPKPLTKSEIREQRRRDEKNLPPPVNHQSKKDMERQERFEAYKRNRESQKKKESEGENLQ